MKILILDDDNERILWLVNRLTPNYVFICKTADEAINALLRYNFQFIFLDHDLSDEHYQIYHDCVRNDGVPVPYIDKFDNETGYAVAKFLADNSNINKDACVFIHSQNRFQAERMRKLLAESGRCVKLAPWNHQTALNSICTMVRCWKEK